MLAQPEKIEQTSKSPKNIQYPISIALFYLFSVLSESVGPVFFLFRERRAPRFSRAAAIARAPRQPPQPPLCLIIYASAAAGNPHRGQRQNTLKIHANPLSIYYTRKKAVFNADSKNNPSDENPADQRDEEAYRPRHEALPDDQPRGPAPSQLPLDRRHRRHARRV